MGLGRIRGREVVMHVNRALLGWGVFFLVLGSVPLAVRYGLVDPAVFDAAWRLWPLLLIGAGLGLVLARTRAAVVGGLVVAATAGLMVGGLVVNGVEGFGGGLASCGGSGSGTPFADQRGTLGAHAAVSLQLDCGQVEVASVDGAGWTLGGESHDGRPPVVTDRVDQLTVEARARQDGFQLGGDGGNRWLVELPRDTGTSLDLSVNAGSAVGAFDGMRLERVQVSVNAGSAALDLGNAVELSSLDASANAGSLAVTLPALSMTGNLSANAGSLELCVPEGVDLRIQLEDNALASNNFAEAGLVEVADTWTRFGGGSARIDLTASANLGSITLNPDDGCA
jgi:hypothetical protein